MSTITTAVATAQATLHPSKTSVVIHLDLDCFYAQVEAVRLGIPLDEPFGVSQWGALLAISYSAKKLGISRMDTVRDAKLKCDKFQWCHTACYAAGDREPQYYPAEQIQKNTHKVSLDTYRNASKRIFAVLRSFDPDALEKGGTDEAFLDVTTLAQKRVEKEFQGKSLEYAMEMVSKIDRGVLINEAICLKREEEARKKMEAESGTAAMMAGHDNTSNNRRVVDDDDDDDNNNDGDDDVPRTTVIQLPIASSQEVKNNNNDNQSAAEKNFGDDPEELKFLLLGGALVCYDIRKAILDRLGYRCSAGVSTNRRVSKAASSSFKPNQQALIFPALHSNFLRSMPISKLRGFGGKFGKKVRYFFGVELTADLMAASIPQLTQCLDGDSNEAQAVYNIIRGREVIGDNTSAVKNRTAPVSLMSQKAFLPAAPNLERLDQWIIVLATELQNRIADCREQFKMIPMSLNVKLGSTSLADFSNVMNATSALPSGATAEMIRTIVKRLCDRGAGFGNGTMVNIITITATRMSPVGVGESSKKNVQASLHQFFKSAPPSTTTANASSNNNNNNNNNNAITIPLRRERESQAHHHPVAIKQEKASSSVVDVVEISDDENDDEITIVQNAKDNSRKKIASSSNSSSPMKQGRGVSSSSQQIVLLSQLSTSSSTTTAGSSKGDSSEEAIELD